MRRGGGERGAGVKGKPKPAGKGGGGGAHRPRGFGLRNLLKLSLSAVSQTTWEIHTGITCNLYLFCLEGLGFRV